MSEYSLRILIKSTPFLFLLNCYWSANYLKSISAKENDIYIYIHMIVHFTPYVPLVQGRSAYYWAGPWVADKGKATIQVVSR